MLRLIEESGSAEYYDPIKEESRGDDHLISDAARLIDILCRQDKLA